MPSTRSTPSLLSRHWFPAPAGETAQAQRRPEEEDRSTRVRWRFARLFWYEQGGYLYDVIRGLEKDASLRPNQIFAPLSSLSPRVRTRRA